MVSAAGGRYRLWSTNTVEYVTPKTRTKFRPWFWLLRSSPWNSLPSGLHDITNTSTFKQWLKRVPFHHCTVLLDVAYSSARQISYWTELKLHDGLVLTIMMSAYLWCRQDSGADATDIIDLSVQTKTHTHTHTYRHTHTDTHSKNTHRHFSAPCLMQLLLSRYTL